MKNTGVLHINIHKLHTNDKDVALQCYMSTLKPECVYKAPLMRLRPQVYPFGCLAATQFSSLDQDWRITSPAASPASIGS